jgi:cell division protein FtsQ
MMSDFFIRRSFRLALGAFFSVSLCLILFYSVDSPIKKVVVLGYFNQLSPSCLNDVLANQLHGRPWPSHQEQLFQLSKAHCPWLYRWQWSHSWPSTLVIKVQENQPQLIFNGQSLMNQSEELFTPQPLPSVLPPLRFDGPVDRFSDLLHFYKQAEPLLQLQKRSIIVLKLDAAESFEITLNDGIVLSVSVENALLELSRFLSADSGLFNHPHKPIESIDLRYPHGFAVQWRT